MQMSVSRHNNESVLHDFAKISLAYGRLPSAVLRCLACLHPSLCVQPVGTDTKTKV